MVLIVALGLWWFVGWQIALAFFMGAVVYGLNHECPSPQESDPRKQDYYQGYGPE